MDVLADPLTFTGRFGVLVAPWTAAERFGRYACQVLADDVMHHVGITHERDVADAVSVRFQKTATPARGTR